MGSGKLSGVLRTVATVKVLHQDSVDAIHTNVVTPVLPCQSGLVDSPTPHVGMVLRLIAWRRCGSVVGSKFRRVGLLSHTVNALPKMCEKNGKLSVCRPPNTPAPRPDIFGVRKGSTRRMALSELARLARTERMWQGVTPRGVAVLAQARRRRFREYTSHLRTSASRWPPLFSRVSWTELCPLHRRLARLLQHSRLSCFQSRASMRS